LNLPNLGVCFGAFFCLSKRRHKKTASSGAALFSSRFKHIHLQPKQHKRTVKVATLRNFVISHKEVPITCRFFKLLIMKLLSKLATEKLLIFVAVRRNRNRTESHTKKQADKVA
jgi:hypothetical protein